MIDEETRKKIKKLLIKKDSKPIFKITPESVIKKYRKKGIEMPPFTIDLGYPTNSVYIVRDMRGTLYDYDDFDTVNTVDPTGRSYIVGSQENIDELLKDDD